MELPGAETTMIPSLLTLKVTSAFASLEVSKIEIPCAEERSIFRASNPSRSPFKL